MNPKDPADCMLFRDMAPMSWLMLPFGLVFAGVGAGVSCAGLWSLAAARRRRRRLAADPGRPWRADPRWSAGFVFDSHAGRKLFGLWIAALLVSAFISVFVAAVFSQDVPWPPRLFVGVFGLAALGMIVAAVYHTARFSKYGSPRLAMAEMPAVPGRTLTAIVLCRRHVDVEGDFKLTLKCTRITGSGKHRRTETLHESTVEVPHDRDLAREHDGTAVPVEMPVPAKAPPTTAPGENPSVGWTLSVKAATPGVDFGAEFDVPVFNVADESLIERRPEAEKGRPE